MLQDQKNSCLICNRELDQSACVDHCHTTGKVRGLLCRQCNMALGLLKDNIDSLENAINYLKRNK